MPGAAGLTHNMVSVVADNADTEQVQPSDWNDKHYFAGGNLGALLYQGTSGEVQSISSVAAGKVLKSAGAGTVPEWSAVISLIQSALTTTSTDGLSLENETAATNGAQVQISPRLRFRARGWDTDDSTSRTFDWIAEVLPVAGATVSGTLRWGYSLNGAAYTYPFSVSPSAVTSSVPIIAQDAASAIVFGTATDIKIQHPGTGRILFTNGTTDWLDLDGAAQTLLMSSSMQLGWSDIRLSRGAANRLDLASGDSFYVVSGGIGVGGTNSTAGTVYATTGVRVDAGSYLGWAGSTGALLRSAGAAKLNYLNANEDAGVGFDFGTDAVLKLRTRAQSAYATLDVLGLQASGVAGASFSGAVTNITVVNGIVTAVS